MRLAFIEPAAKIVDALNGAHSNLIAMLDAWRPSFVLILNGKTDFGLIVLGTRLLQSFVPPSGIGNGQAALRALNLKAWL